MLCRREVANSILVIIQYPSLQLPRLLVSLWSAWCEERNLFNTDSNYSATSLCLKGVSRLIVRSHVYGFGVKPLTLTAVNFLAVVLESFAR